MPITRPPAGRADHPGAEKPHGDPPPLFAEDHVCEPCAFRYADCTAPAAAAMIRGCPARYRRVLAGLDDAALRRRPGPRTWSALEYACHVRDVYAVYTDRVRRALSEERPVLEPMRNDLRADRGAYNRQDPGRVMDDLEVNVETFLGVVASVSGVQWERVVTRLPGETRSVLWLVRQAAHEGRHHLRDIEDVSTRW